MGQGGLATTLTREKLLTVPTSNAFLLDVVDLLPARVRSYPGKRLLDFLLAGTGLLFLAPLMALVALAIIVASPGPVIFSHERIGANGRRFKCLKFRTMCVGAAERLQQLLESDEKLRGEFAANQKLRNDPRVNRLGAFLRRTSIDELPQLCNVLVGHMSVVGPRPIVTEELALYGDAVTEYLCVRPGLTGAWQVSGRSDTTYRERVELDREYVQSLSLRIDLRIIRRTFRAAVRGGY